MNSPPSRNGGRQAPASRTLESTKRRRLTAHGSGKQVRRNGRFAPVMRRWREHGDWIWRRFLRTNNRRDLRALIRHLTAMEGCLRT
jgi:hypothetical protein